MLALARGQLAAHGTRSISAQRARFLRHARSAWDVNRHRVPAGPLSAVRTLARAGVLDVHAGRLEEVNALDDAVEVIWRPRGATRTRAWLVDRVINCTGPDCRVERTRRSAGAVAAVERHSSAPTRCRSASTSPTTAGRSRATARR